MEGLLIASKPYSMPLKYHEFMDHKIKWLKEAGIISQSMSNWASPILVVPKKEKCVDTSDNQAVVKMGHSTCGFVLTIENSTVGYKQHAK